MNKSDSGVRMGDLESAFGAIESIRRDVSANELKVVTLESRVKSLEKNNDEISRMRTEVNEKLEILLAKKHRDDANEEHNTITKKNVILLMEDYQQRKGANRLVSWTPAIVTIIGVIYTIFGK